jgi:hypothetical protein
MAEVEKEPESTTAPYHECLNISTTGLSAVGWTSSTTDLRPNITGARLFAIGHSIAGPYCYGTRGAGFIHVHHLKPLSKIRKNYKDPMKDLIPVCPNCHSMLHRESEILSIAQLKKIVRVII